MHRKASVFAVLLLSSILGVSSVIGVTRASWAEDQSVSPSPSRSDEIGSSLKQDYLAAAARLFLRFGGHSELTGEYRIGPDFSISVPVLGRFSLLGVDIAGLETSLSKKLGQLTGKDAYVTVEIAAYKPIFVTGSVKNPGALEWRPSLNVLQAVALSGGLAFGPSGENGSPSQGPDRVQFAKIIDAQSRDIAALARLKAQRAGSTMITVPPALTRAVGPERANALIAQEEKTLTSATQSTKAKLTELDKGIDVGSTQITAMREQKAKLTDQLKLRKDYREKVQTLLSRGIVNNQRALEEDIKISDLEEKITNIDVGIASISGTIAQLELNAVTLQRDQESSIDAEIARTEREEAQFEIDIRATRPPDLVVQASTKDNSESAVRFQIVRVMSGRTTNMRADEATSLIAGDVLTVMLQ